jgi:HSP20 family protein
MKGHGDDLIRDMRHLQETMERLLSDFSRLRMPLMLSKESVWRPLTDVYETDGELIVRMEIAGMDPKDLSVTLGERLLVLKGIRRDPGRSERRHFHKMEVTVGPFERIIEIPDRLRVSSVDAHYENGFLTVRLHKGVRSVTAPERTIPVERGA